MSRENRSELDREDIPRLLKLIDIFKHTSFEKAHNPNVMVVA